MPRTRKEKGHYGRPWLRLRSQVMFEEQVCWLCGQWVDQNLHYLHPGAPQVHLSVPLTQGGSWRDRNNCHLAHRACNIRQSNKWEGTVDHSQGPRDERGEAFIWVAGEEP